MSLFGGIAKSLINPMTLMQLAMGPAGWASIAMKAIGTAIAQQVIQQLGQQLGLPPAVINMAQQAFSSATGQPFSRAGSIAETVSGLAEQFNLTPSQAGQLERSAEFDVQEMLKSLTKASAEGKAKAERGGKDGGGSYLRRIAEAMAKAMDGKIEEMDSLAKRMDGVKHQKGKTDSTQIQTDLQVATQEFSMMMQSTANIIKTIGEGMSNMSRKG